MRTTYSTTRTIQKNLIVLYILTATLISIREKMIQILETRDISREQRRIAVHTSREHIRKITPMDRTAIHMAIIRMAVLRRNTEHGLMDRECIMQAAMER